MNYEQATNYSITIPATLMIAVPLVSYSVDRKYNKSIYLMLSAVTGILAFLSLYYIEGTKWTALPCLMFVGVYYSLFSSSIWSAGAQSCPETMIDIGLAVMDSVQSIATFFFPIIFEHLNIDTPGRLLPILIGFNMAGLVLSVWLWFSPAQYVLLPDIKQKKLKKQDLRRKTEPKLYQRKKK